MPSSRKKAIFRKFSRDWLAGYLPAADFAHAGRVEMLDLDGKVVHLAVEDLKWICYVRDFNSGELNNPERLLRKTFSGRPRGEGLFVRVRLKDGDLIEGLAGNDVTLVASDGLFLTPPDLRSNTQRLWLPRTSIEELEVLAVIGAAKKKAAVAEDEESAQEKLF
jgi:hypothetical protein